MKYAVILLLFTSSLSAQIDTIYSDLTPVMMKKTTIKVTSITGDEITEKREVITYDKALKKIEQLARDTAQFTQYFKSMKNMEDNLLAEKRRVIMIRRDAVATLKKLNALLNSLK